VKRARETGPSRVLVRKGGFDRTVLARISLCFHLLKIRMELSWASGVVWMVLLGDGRFVSHLLA
jgi:hypothetical protein